MSRLISNRALPIVDNQDDSFKRNMESIVFGERKNILLLNTKNFKEYLESNFDKYSDSFIFVDIDLILGNERIDFIEQICDTFQKLFPGNTNIQSQFMKLFEQHAQHPVIKDKIFYSFFNELLADRHIIIVIDNFSQHVDYISETDYNRLTILHRNESKKKISFVVIIQNEDLSILKKTYRRGIFFDTFDNSSSPLLNSLPNKNIIYNTNMNKPEVFISYAWGGESEQIVNEICEQLTSNRIIYHRDKKDIRYKGNIREFEERLGKGDYIILVVSDVFLKSKNCMYEILQIINAGNVYERIFPIVLEDAKIYDPITIIDYIGYWENETNELNDRMKTISSANQGGLRDDIDNYVKYREVIPEILTILSRMNNLTVHKHRNSNYLELINAIESQYKKEIKTKNIKSTNNTTSEEIEQRSISQYGNKSVYIEKNNGNIIIN